MPVPIKTTCPYCGVGCGVIAQVETNGKVNVTGDPEHPANFGRLCSKGAALGDTLGMEGRLLSPQFNGQNISWDAALDTVASRFQHIIKEHGSDAVAFYVSGQLLTEDYYVANKLMKGFIGSANIDTNSRLCMSSAVAGQKRAFGSDTVPCSYEDLENAKLVILTGSNTAWCHPVLFQRIKKARQDNPEMRVVVIDPRETATADIADQHIAIKPGTDHVLFNGLLLYLAQHGIQDDLFVKNHTEGLEQVLSSAKSFAATVNEVAALCNLPVNIVENFYRLFSNTEQVVTLYSQGINQWSYGTDRVNSIINCHLLTGRIGRVGMGPFSITGQPNAMGGREVGGLANQLAAHMAIENPSHRELVKTFWQSPTIAEHEGLKAVDLFNAIDEGKIKAVWIMATNPAVSLPDTNKVKRALEKCEFVVVSDCMQETDTTKFAHVLLPATTWGEREGTVTNSERRISRQRAFIEAPGAARADWWILSEVAKRMGYADAFSYQGPVDIFKEHAALSGYHNSADHIAGKPYQNNLRDFNISALAAINDDDYNALRPTQWPITAEAPQGTSRLFADGQFYTPSGKARFIVIENSQPKNALSAEYPLRLNSGRIRDQWHTMTRTAKTARLSAHIYEPFIEIHPFDAETAKIQHNELVSVKSQWGDVVCRAIVTTSQQQGSVFIPIHWNEQYASQALVDSLIDAAVDPISGQPEYKSTPVNITAYKAHWYGFLLSRRKLEITTASYWTCSRGDGVWRYEIAGDEIPENWAECARSLLCQDAQQVEWTEYHDAAVNRYRAARIENGLLESCIFIGPEFSLPERDWLIKLFKDEKLDDTDRASILTGKSASPQKDVGRIVCACFNVGTNTIIDAIQSQKLVTAEDVGKALRAGTNCGSCVPEIHKLIATTMETSTD